MNLLQGESNESQSISILKDPFAKKNVCSISIFVYNEANYNRNKKGVDCRASVLFMNGKTSGQQDFQAYTNFKELLTAIDAFIASLPDVTKEATK